VATAPSSSYLQREDPGELPTGDRRGAPLTHSRLYRKDTPYSRHAWGTAVKGDCIPAELVNFHISQRFVGSTR
ncbi:hypothetical protein CCH79_00018890, partial [Gambusia affinis]